MNFNWIRKFLEWGMFRYVDNDLITLTEMVKHHTRKHEFFLAWSRAIEAEIMVISLYSRRNDLYAMGHPCYHKIYRHKDR